MNGKVIPVVLFAYKRPHHLKLTLECLRADEVPLLIIYCDGLRDQGDMNQVNTVRKMVRAIDWCSVRVVERERNLGLGLSIRTGVAEVLKEYGAGIVFEDDLICVPGTYQYLTSALRRYSNDRRVMSVTGWTHSSVTPDDVTDLPYFDGRGESWVWGTWARAWEGMCDTAATLVKRCEARGIDPYCYGADLVEMAKVEMSMNLWAVRFLFLHILNRGLCLRPPHSMVEHIGFGSGTNCKDDESPWRSGGLQVCPKLPDVWPNVVENPQCSFLHQRMCGRRPSKVMSIAGKLRQAWLQMRR